ncbi:MAG: hypothetical protein KZQ86_02425, partial [Candidatus Thiodiazotropha sp. (ex Lucinoma kastoroae)]|nr:hypothetical protein [Candidatus Thiodiazotropha sp. (ex Lucinoma kastoroae)]
TDGTLIFRAHLCRLVNQCSASIIRIKLSKSNRINQVLQQIGVLELLGQNPHIKTDHPDVINWHFAQGAGALGVKTETILGPHEGSFKEALQKGLYLGLTEAMTNTRQHAYPNSKPSEDYTSEDNNEWWMFSQEKDGKVYVVFCDLGIGIPNSLPNKKPALWEKIKEKVGGIPSDSRIISEAIKYSRSRTGQDYRGKGLGQLTSILSKTKGGNLRLFSNQGCYNVADGIIRRNDYRDSIQGTLISWSISLTH